MNDEEKNITNTTPDMSANDLVNDLFDKAASASLSGKEREGIRARLSLYAAAHSPKQSFDESPKPSPVESMFFPRAFTYFAWYRSPRILSAVAMIVLVFSGGISYAAKGTLPGDLLYPIKVNVNEKVTSFLSVGAKAVANTSASQAVARLEEVEKLAAENKLDDTLQNMAKQMFDEKARKVVSTVEELEKQGDVETAVQVSSEFSADLQNHRGILDVLSSTKDGNEKALLSDLAGAVNDHLQSAIRTVAEIESRSALSITSQIEEGGTLMMSATATTVQGSDVSTTTARTAATTTPAANSTSTSATTTENGQ